jgi:hypothetical protein
MQKHRQNQILYGVNASVAVLSVALQPAGLALPLFHEGMEKGTQIHNDDIYYTQSFQAST